VGARLRPVPLHTRDLLTGFQAHSPFQRGGRKGGREGREEKGTGRPLPTTVRRNRRPECSVRSRSTAVAHEAARKMKGRGGEREEEQVLIDKRQVKSGLGFHRNSAFQFLLVDGGERERGFLYPSCSWGFANFLGRP